MSTDTTVAVEKGHFLLGSAKEVKKDFLAFMHRLAIEHGHLSKFFIGKGAVYLIGDPNMVEQVMIKHRDRFEKPYEPENPRGLALVLGRGLVTSHGPLWQRQRRMMQPIFHKSNLSTMVEVMTSQADNFIQTLRAHEGSEYDISTPVSTLTLEIISRTMFGKDASDFGDQLPKKLEVLLKFAMTNFFHPFPLPLYIPTKRNRTFNSARHYLRKTIGSIISQRRQTENEQDDLLQLLLNSRDADSGEPMSEEQIIDEAITMYSAGHETTAAALIWTLYLLATHKDIQHNLQQEIDSVLGQRKPLYEDLEQLVLTRAIIEESMRLYPPIVLLLRKVLADTTINGVTFEKGAYTIVNLYNLNHDPDIWDSPEEFRPQRFIGNDSESKGKPFYPFGIGHRVCIGNHFAMMEACLLLSQIVQSFNIDYLNKTKPTPKLAISLRPEQGMPLTFNQRSSVTNTTSGIFSKQNT